MMNRIAEEVVLVEVVHAATACVLPTVEMNVKAMQSGRPLHARGTARELVTQHVKTFAIIHLNIN